MEYPVSFTFKILAVAPQIYVTDANNTPIFYVKQKLLKLKEEITVFSDDSQSTELCHIKADRIIDFSAKYFFTTPNGDPLGAVSRDGGRSLWKASYQIYDKERAGSDMKINEESAWVRFMDGLLGQIPILGLLTGYLFHPSYLVTRKDEVVMRLTKQAAMLESKFFVEKMVDMEPEEETRILLALLMMILLERSRG